ncbi:Sulfotransferase family protein [Methylocella tundrae]|uniref:Sulfotransferase family protein n=1 Tax=Methylocella tundrae TaxID=227605 RepID=A0A8B6M3B9_METTU|nr:sulfotransferase [Methylocella tundrae]VTZ25413.1 Sulfotransferase family protein [Methylocella tundrae]VTZ49537.1 Sulfotransferase family protein [Methylocella tundrae]
MADPTMQRSRSDVAQDPLEPIILLGRGGSGTRLLSAFAASNGIFLGNMLNATADSVEWVQDIYELAIESTTVGVDAGSTRDAYWRERLRGTAGRILSAAGLPSDVAWGWKLPETMLALPQVLRAFPRARVVHLVRHPVTSSLRRTHMTSRLSNPVGQVVLPAAYVACGLNPKNIEFDEPYLHNAVTWTYQVGNVCRALSKTLADERHLQLRYEEICANPVETHCELGKFLGKNVVPMNEIPDIDWARVSKFDINDERPERIWSICGEVAIALGYAKDGPAVRSINAPHPI